MQVRYSPRQLPSARMRSIYMDSLLCGWPCPNQVPTMVAWAQAGDARRTIRHAASRFLKGGMGSDVPSLDALGQFPHLLGGARQLRIQLQGATVQPQRPGLVAIILQHVGQLAQRREVP